MRKKKRSKIKRLVNDNRAVAEVLGSILIMAIILPMVAIFGFTFTDMMTGQRSMMQSQIDAMQRFTDYLNNISFDNSNNSYDSYSIEYKCYERYTKEDLSHAIIQLKETSLTQTFTIGSTGNNKEHETISIKLKVFRKGLPGIFIVSINTVDENGTPSSNKLCIANYNGNTLSENATWTEITFEKPAILQPNTQYAIVVQVPEANIWNSISWRCDMSHGLYTGGCSGTRHGGNPWQMYPLCDFMFEEYGRTY